MTNAADLSAFLKVAESGFSEKNKRCFQIRTRSGIILLLCYVYGWETIGKGNFKFAAN